MNKYFLAKHYFGAALLGKLRSHALSSKSFIGEQDLPLDKL